MFLCPCFYAGEICLEWGHLWETWLRKGGGPGARSHILVQGKVIRPLHLGEQARACAVSAPAIFVAGTIPTFLRVVSLCSRVHFSGVHAEVGRDYQRIPWRAWGSWTIPRAVSGFVHVPFPLPRVRNWEGLGSVLGDGTRHPVCLQAIVAVYSIYKTRAVVLFCTSSLIPLLVTIWSNYLSQWHTVLFKHSLPLQKNFK